MLDDFIGLVRHLVGDSKVEKSKKKPADPLREALLSHGGRETSVHYIVEEFVSNDWNLGFAAIFLKSGAVWKLPGDNLFSMFRDYQMLAELTGGSGLKDIVESLGCAVVLMGLEVKVHMPRTCNRTVLSNVRALRATLDERNKAEQTAFDSKNVVHKVMKSPDVIKVRIIAYEGERVYPHAILR